MAGRSRLDVLDDRVRALEADPRHDPFQAWLKTLTDPQLSRLIALLEAGIDPAVAARETLREETQ